MGLPAVLTASSYPGYSTGFAHTSNPPPVVGWSTPDNKDTGFVSPDGFGSPDIICHKGATPAQEYVTVAAGETVELQWTVWPESHHGPVIDYLANCNGECTSVEKTGLQFNKIDEMGLIDYPAMPGNWASDKLIAANNSWTVTVPSSVAPGNYVLRHEIIALHASQDHNGAQNYPQCVNLKVTGSGTDQLASGTLGTALYTPDDAGIFVNIYEKLAYTIPGPKLYSGASSGTATSASGYAGGASSTTASGTATSAGESAGESVPTANALTTVAPVPTAPFSNSTSPNSKAGKKPCKAAGYPTPQKAHSITGVANQASNTIASTPSITKIPDVPKAPAADTPAADAPESDLPSTVASAPSTTKIPNVQKAAAAGAPDFPSSVPSAPMGDVPAVPSGEPGNEPDLLPREPENKLAEGMTVQELFGWMEIIMAQLKTKMGGKVRRHTRDFLDL
ncbi:MAG: hypothetical protein Q9196_000241 [Gyalolechia fulgens]